MNVETCKHDGCDRPVKHVGECSTHYFRAYREANRSRIKANERARQERVGKPCIVEGCTKIAHIRAGRCDSHQWQERVRSADPCSVQACEKKATARGKCQAHYRRDHVTAEQRWRYTLNGFGVTPEWYEARLTEQGGVCAVCHRQCTVRERLSVDHDHRCCGESAKSCGRCVRGLLCNSCNVAIGYLRDDPQLVRAAAQYLEAWRGDEAEADQDT